MEKLRVNYFKSILAVNITNLILFTAIYFAILQTDLWDNAKSTIIILIYVTFTLVLSIFVPKSYAMTYDDKCFYNIRFGKEDVVAFSDVIYIDEPYTNKHKALTIYLKSGKLKFISFDKDKKILDLFKSKCKNTVTREQFIVMYPNIRL